MGRVVLAPLFIEPTVCCCFLGTYAVVFVFWASQANNVNLIVTNVGYALSLIPALIAFHALRRNTREKLKLIEGLRNFSLEQAEPRKAMPKVRRRLLRDMYPVNVHLRRLNNEWIACLGSRVI